MMIPTNRGPMSAGQIVDELTYINYASNRSAGMTAKQLATLFPVSGAAMEERYQAEEFMARQAECES